jgi:hypothetical protein
MRLNVSLLGDLQRVVDFAKRDQIATTGVCRSKPAVDVPKGSRNEATDGRRPCNASSMIRFRSAKNKELPRTTSAPARSFFMIEKAAAKSAGAGTCSARICKFVARAAVSKFLRATAFDGTVGFVRPLSSSRTLHSTLGADELRGPR